MNSSASPQLWPPGQDSDVATSAAAAARLLLFVSCNHMPPRLLHSVAVLGLHVIGAALPDEREARLVPPQDHSLRDYRSLQQENALLRRHLAALEGNLRSGTVAAALALHKHQNGSVLFTRSRLESIGGQARQVILTFVNTARLDFARTWASHLRRMGVSNWLIGATDAAALEGLQHASIPCFALHTRLPGSEWSWGSPNFHGLGPVKVRLIHMVLLWDLELVITDVDAMVLRPPFEFMAKWPDAGFLTTSDHLSNTTAESDGLETHSAGSAYNIGYMVRRRARLKPSQALGIPQSAA